MVNSIYTILPPYEYYLRAVVRAAMGIYHTLTGYAFSRTADKECLV
jgi:hypothetical protein